jgi:catechol 2,3-dioxygenase-like lactoylglutathione lyase family enzyme
MLVPRDDCAILVCPANLRHPLCRDDARLAVRRPEGDHPRHTARFCWPPRAGSAADRGLVYCAAVQIDLVALIVEQYDPAIAFFTGVLGFDLVEDSPSLTNDGRPKRWVVVRPPGAQTGILLARADGERQRSAVGDQVAGRVGFFLRVDDFDGTYRRMVEAGVTFVQEPRTESYGQVAVFLDISGNRWDLLGAGGRRAT